MKELRRFSRSRLTRAAIAAVVMLPLLYAGLYLWSFWDPQGHLDRVPVALVMQDRPATADGKPLHAGQDLAEELREREVFDWHAATPEQAADGVRDGSYYLSLTIPSDFSSRLASPSKDGTPSPAELGVEVDTGRSYIMSSISDAVFNEVRAAAAQTAVRDYLDQVFVSIGDMHDKTTEAADGADELHEGADKIDKGLGRTEDATQQLSTGLGQTRNGAQQLTAGLGSANTATGKLAEGSAKVTKGLVTAQDGLTKLGTGLTKLGEGSAKVATGARQVSDQVHANSGKVNAAADTAIPVLEEWGPKVGEAADHLADGLDAIADGLGAEPGSGSDAGAAARIGAKLDRVSGAASEAADSAQAVQNRLDADPDADPELRRLARAAASSAQSAATSARSAADEAGSLGGNGSGTSSQTRQTIAELQREARQLAANARKVAEAAPKAGPQVAALREQYNALDAGLAKLADGAAQVDAGVAKSGTAVGKLETGVGKLADGSQQVTDGLGELGGGLVKLTDGASRLRTGVGRLNDGADQLHTGVGKLHDGSGKISDGSKELADGLADGAEQIPDYSKSERDGRTDMMSDPVRLATSVDNEVPNYGTGFAPFFVPLALWVGAMIVYMVLRPLNPRLLAGTAGALRVAFSGWFPAMALGAAQVGVLLTVLKFALGLEAAHWAGVAGLLLLTAAAFMAIVQAVNALLGAPGRVAALALLMLQLTSAAGTYPIETSPGFFQTISPWLPMSWVVSALRRLISGGDLTVVWQACGVLTLFLLLGLALTVLAVNKGRTWSVRRLHPELSL
ncbi:YhgE/Pip domain-containing protein [Nonomuraea dietziae]|uniref:Putative membrane protein n=1 Tax=Nonomuraea dietziae TaxID=65515 RepID=A0A7W5VAI2_9ACTN|nr:YhgE/Pip domain-containing protein [Nonomuraea dietziae]MBB3728175.1 putative membrane protein [Nonomuraea dietziae]